MWPIIAGSTTNLPAGWEDFGGYVVGSDQYGVYLIRKVEQQGSLMLWLERWFAATTTQWAAAALTWK